MTPHFHIEEFTASDTAARAGIDNTLPPELVPAALATLQMMERIRAHLGSVLGREVPIRVTSGYRCPQLNWAVRFPLRGPGQDASGDHPRAAAVDFKAPSFGSAFEIASTLAPLVGALGIGQLINEMPPHGWVHVSTRLPSKMVNRIITAYPGGRFAAGVVA